MTEPQYGRFPTDPELIKHEIGIRRQAVRIMFSEITALQQALMKHMAPEEWLRYQAEMAASEEADMLGEVKQHEAPAPEDRSQWQLNDYLEKDTEWQEYLRKA